MYWRWPTIQMISAPTVPMTKVESQPGPLFNSSSRNPSIIFIEGEFGGAHFRDTHAKSILRLRVLRIQERVFEAACVGVGLCYARTNDLQGDTFDRQLKLE